MRNEIVRFVRLVDVEDYSRIGWVPSSIDGGLIGTPHAVYGIVMVWQCGCKPKNLIPQEVPFQ